MTELQFLGQEMGIKGRVKPIPFPVDTIERIEKIGKTYSKPFSRFAYYWLYLTGQRIGEAVRSKRANIDIQEMDGQEYIIVNSITEKNRYNPRRTIPIPYGFKKESYMSRYVWDYIEKLDSEQPIMVRFEDGESIQMSRTNVWNCLKKVNIKILSISPENRNIFETRLRIFPHYQRHCRATHMVTYYNYGLVKLMQHFGWASPATPSIYVSLNWRKLAQSFSEVERNIDI